MPTLTTWLDEAARMPIAFALVREDPLLDREVLRQCPKKARILMIASGGCTASLLAAESNVDHLELVDPNPAQLQLAQLKWHLLRNEEPHRRAAILGHAPMDVEERRDYLNNLAGPDILGPMERVATLGPDHAGRYEMLFARLRDVLRPRAHEIEKLLTLHDTVEQSRRVHPGTPLGEALDAAYDEVLALPNLVRLFGESATQNPVEPFSRHFARRTRTTLEQLPAATNPYLWSMLLGRFAAVSLPWLTLPRQPRLRKIVCTRAMMDDALAGAKGYHFIHLSNILDWLTQDQARHTLELAHRALNPGGYVFIRQLNSTLDIGSLGSKFEWDHTRGSEMLARDRSFFYRALHLGRKP
jgi:S-adenosylmethionine-diacylglycerol 3-amino-3-carboxypropyl transferase